MQSTLNKNKNSPLILPDDMANRELVANVHPLDWQNPAPAARYNLVVIGGGSAGLVAAAGAAGLGARVALIERHLLGGDCLNVGCVPSKSLLHPARVVGELRRAALSGVTVGPVEVDFGAVMARLRQVRADISIHDSAQRFRGLGVDVFLGEGRFSGSDAVEVDGQLLRFSKAVIATGSRPGAPPIPGLAEAGYLTNETVFELTERPRRLAIIGAGPIGAELGQAFRRFGSDVTLFDVLPRLLGREDEEAAALLAEVFAGEGIHLALGSEIKAVSATASGKCLEYVLDGQSRRLEVDAILVAAGRAPNVESLNLETAGIAYTKMGLQVDDTLRTTNPRVYGAGDVAFRYQFTHAADATARLVLRNALFPGPKQKASSLLIPWVTYTDPEVAHVGRYDVTAEAEGIRVQSFVQPLAETDRGRTDGVERGFVKVHVRAGSDKILGATIAGPRAGEMIAEIGVAMTAGMGLQKLAMVIHPYPTLAEAIKKVADSYNRTRLTPTTRRLFGWWFARTR